MTTEHLSPAVLRRAIASTMLPGFEGTELPEWVAERLRQGMGGVCLFSTNIGSPEQLRALNAAILEANPDAVIAIDEEGGDVTRLHHQVGSPYPGNAILGRLNEPARTEQIAAGLGDELRAAGCTMTFAPDADINNNPDNPVIGTRSFGTEPALVAEHTGAWVRGIQRSGIAASTKHFPGHGDTALDSHLALPVIDVSLEVLRERELEPFRAAIAAGTDSIMTSHIMLPQVDPEHPATLSHRILQGLLREELGFEGVIVSDALDMKGASGETGIPEAAVRAIAAGCDLLCIGTDNSDAQMAEIEEHVAVAILEGRLSAERVLDAASRLRELAERGRRLRAGAPESPAPAWPDAVTVAASFDIRSGVNFAPLSASDPVTVMTVEGVPNIAVGFLPWGIPAAIAEPSIRERWEAQGLRVLHSAGLSAEETLEQLAGAQRIVFVGQNNHRTPLNREIITALRAGGAPVLVVDMGWASPEREYADIATFGASKLVGEAFLGLLEHGVAR